MIQNQAGQVVFAQMTSRQTGGEFTDTPTVKVSVQTTGGSADYNTGAGTLEHKGGGLWAYYPTQAETNGNKLAFQFSHVNAFTITVQMPTDALSITVSVPSSVAAASTESNYIVCKRGDRLSRSFVIGNITTRTKLWFTVKRKSSDADSAAFIQITEAGGLLYYDGSPAANSALGSIVVTNATTGAITITIHESLTALFDKTKFPNGVFDIQVLTTSGPNTPLEGAFTIDPDITHAVS